MREQGSLTPFNPPVWHRKATPADYLRTLIFDSPVAIIALDSQHRLELCNPAFEALFQYTEDELLGTNPDSLIASPELAGEANRFSERVLQGEKVYAMTKRRRRNGSMVDVEISGIPLLASGQVAGVYGLYLDVTERTRAQTAFRAISEQMDTLQQEERRQVARDLHDATAQELTVLNWNLARLSRMVAEGGDELRTLVQETREIALKCSASIRSASWLLHPPVLEQGGLAMALPWLVEGFEQRSGIRVHLDIHGRVDSLDPELEGAVFRIVQEALTNVLRHSGSAVAQIRLRSKPDALCLEVSDQGGLHRTAQEPADRAPYGVGIAGMRERAAQMGGWLRVSTTGTGTTLYAHLPLRRRVS